MSAFIAGGYHFRDYIDQFELWQLLTNTQRDDLVSHTRFEHYKKGTSVYRGPLSSAGTLHVISGALRAFVLSE